MNMQMDKPQSNKLKEVFLVFFKLGCFAFGGPAAHIAFMEDEIIERRKWMSRQHFLDLIGGTNLIPGPNSTEMTMHCGYERAGAKGLFVAGISFIFPAVLISGILAYLYVSYGKVPQVEDWIFGIKPAVLAVILAAVIKLGKKALKSWELLMIGLGVLAASLLGVNEIVALLCGGVLGCLFFSIKYQRSTLQSYFLPFILLNGQWGVFSHPSFKIFLSFLKVGSILYGSGYVLFAYLEAELVAPGLLTRMELIDAIAIGQMTPGPVLSTATFIGYQLGGWQGAIGATLGIFLPSFLFVWLLNPLIPKMRQSKILSYFLDSVNVAALAVMAAVLISMGRDVLIDWKAWFIVLISLLLTFGPKKVHPIIIILMGSIVGFVLIRFITI